MLVAGFLAVPGISMATTPTAAANASAADRLAGAATQEQQPPATPQAEPTPPSSQTPSTQPPSTTPPSSTPSQQPTSPQPPTTPTTEPPTTTQPPTTAQPPADPTAQAQVDPDAAKKALTAARDSLAQMTQLPAAQALTGEPRAQVSQLISNFNELITTNSDWKAAYAKVDANLTALMGSQGADESAAPSAAPSTAARARAPQEPSPARHTGFVSIAPAIR